jgi:hypothetical protein
MVTPPPNELRPCESPARSIITPPLPPAVVETLPAVILTAPPSLVPLVADPVLTIKDPGNPPYELPTDMDTFPEIPPVVEVGPVAIDNDPLAPDDAVPLKILMLPVCTPLLVASRKLPLPWDLPAPVVTLMEPPVTNEYPARSDIAPPTADNDVPASKVIVPPLPPASDCPARSCIPPAVPDEELPVAIDTVPDIPDVPALLVPILIAPLEDATLTPLWICMLPPVASIAVPLPIETLPPTFRRDKPFDNPACIEIEPP